MSAATRQPAEFRSSRGTKPGAAEFGSSRKPVVRSTARRRYDPIPATIPSKKAGTLVIPETPSSLHTPARFVAAHGSTVSAAASTFIFLYFFTFCIGWLLGASVGAIIRWRLRSRCNDRSRSNCSMQMMTWEDDERIDSWERGKLKPELQLDFLRHHGVVPVAAP